MESLTTLPGAEEHPEDLVTVTDQERTTFGADQVSGAGGSVPHRVWERIGERVDRSTSIARALADLIPMSLSRHCPAR